MIFLDNHSTTPIDRRVLEKIFSVSLESIGNAHSVEHSLGEASAHLILEARQEVASLVDADLESVVFTSGATESINIAIVGACLKHGGKGPFRIALPPVEHKAVIETCISLSNKGLAQIKWLTVDSKGRIDLAEIGRVLKGGVELICLMAANNEIGNLYPIEHVGRLAREFGAKFFCDGTQAVGKTKFSFPDANLDYLAFSSHKIYGPKGVGALVIRDKDSLLPIFYGGSQEFGLRPGTLNVPGISGFGFACRLRKTEMETDEEHVCRLRDRLQEKILKRIPEARVNGELKRRLAGNLHISFPYIPNDAIIARVRRCLAISTGSACSSGAESPSHVLKAIKMSENNIVGSVRFGVGKFNTIEEIDETASLVVDAVEKIRISMGPIADA